MFGTCHKCGGSDANDFLNKSEKRPIYNPLQDLAEKCSKCSKKLYSTCNFCKGSGHVDQILDYNDYGNNYCSHCGRSLKKKYTSTCSNCNGSGFEKNIHVCNFF